MNLDNKRLKEIQRFKIAYQHEMDKAETVADCITIQNYINDLEEEEKEILERTGVEI